MRGPFSFLLYFFYIKRIEEGVCVADRRPDVFEGGRILHHTPHLILPCLPYYLLPFPVYWSMCFWGEVKRIPMVSLPSSHPLSSPTPPGREIVAPAPINSPPIRRFVRVFPAPPPLEDPLPLSPAEIESDFIPFLPPPVHSPRRPRVWLTLNKYIKHPKHGLVLLNPDSGNGRE